MWEYEYNEADDETTIYWDDSAKATVSGKITEWKNGYPLGGARDVVATVIQDADPAVRIKMEYDFNYGFTKR